MKLPENIVNGLILEIGKKELIPLVNLIREKKIISEFKIAEKLDMGVNQVRNMLYKLHSFNLVEFSRKKDKRKGWYIYSWTFDDKQALDLVLNLKNKKLEGLKKSLEEENKGSSFICPEKCVRYNSTEAMESNFRCNECGEVVVEENKEKALKRIEKEIRDTENELKEINDFTKEEEEKNKRSLERRRLKEEREKKVKKKTKIKEKIKKKVVKKPIKKKVVKKVKKKPVKKIKKKVVKKVKKKPVKKIKKKVVKKVIGFIFKRKKKSS